MNSTIQKLTTVDPMTQNNDLGTIHKRRPPHRNERRRSAKRDENGLGDGGFDQT